MFTKGNKGDELIHNRSILSAYSSSTTLTSRRRNCCFVLMSCRVDSCVVGRRCQFLAFFSIIWKRVSQRASFTRHRHAIDWSKSAEKEEEGGYSTGANATKEEERERERKRKKGEAKNWWWRQRNKEQLETLGWLVHLVSLRIASYRVVSYRRRSIRNWSLARSQVVRVSCALSFFFFEKRSQETNWIATPNSFFFFLAGYNLFRAVLQQQQQELFKKYAYSCLLNLLLCAAADVRNDDNCCSWRRVPARPGTKINSVTLSRIRRPETKKNSIRHIALLISNESL